MERKSPSTIGNYIIGEQIGAGSFSHVNLVRDKTTGRQLCVKIISKARIEKDKDIKHTQDEISTLSSIFHPNIVRYHRLMMDDDFIYIFMEHCSGKSLLKLINERGPLSDDCCKQIMQQLLATLSFLHSNQIYHRDIKPDNIIVDSKMRIKLIDFGLCSNKGSSTNSILSSNSSDSKDFQNAKSSRNVNWPKKCKISKNASISANYTAQNTSGSQSTPNSRSNSPNNILNPFKQSHFQNNSNLTSNLNSTSGHISNKRSNVTSHLKYSEKISKLESNETSKCQQPDSNSNPGTKVSNDNHLLTTFCGSLIYTAPECIRKENYDGGCADIWSLGVTLYAMVAGHLPWDHQKANRSTMMAILEGPIVPPHQATPACADLIIQMLQYYPSQRPTAEQALTHYWFADLSCEKPSTSNKNSICCSTCLKPVFLKINFDDRRVPFSKHGLVNVRHMSSRKRLKMIDNTNHPSTFSV
ncbi:hypothetical protein TRFO_40320 [Tritrichomonas foetus]|uniref:Protein kinase domain-containing protein n=1 Tax=Tritrichomonas foetus TaxID=1144522 RepID=A0A1J4J1G0_9EUKA|nr:hypothetical protein TRFO_40320 [Tritrichomonas foetus]|eukprot:OHS93376.1 hypothetical protein TRFO_40320 [Tritrichomonas foetus]